ncbi:Na+/H+ antiporter NhaA [Cellulomonas sp. ES6]|uniref:Na+/H+ antiporter NhaA n=1 Tax=Cellulomonas sp. ES6 TaxID=3039384 RepID=UPI0024B73F7B|nr:Na+/H+ antiporter NhaA [Cellulomonas sp. ES6]WHP18044.1 Na+/H+ antiporter NhaA [Cellulomonas sp. ES6]
MPHPTHLPAPTGLRRWASAETTGGALLIAAAVLALVWANSPWRDAYHEVSSLVVGIEAWHLDLDLAHWASDGLLAVFFFVVGLELKHEIVAGSLRDPRRAAVPVVAAVGGMLVPAAVYLAVVGVAGDAPSRAGWAVPTATDIAFALAVLAIFGRGLPVAIRTFLLTLAVVDDLLAIVVIAVSYSDGVAAGPLAGSVGAVVLFALVARSPYVHPWLLWALGLVAWACMHASGVHATIAGVLLGLTVPARPVNAEHVTRVQRYEHAMRPWSAVVALPLFAFFAAGVTLVGGAGLAGVLGDPVVPGVVLGLVLGKVVGIVGAVAVVTRVSPLRLPDGVGLRDLLPVGLLAGIGFTVSLLIAELAFAGDDGRAGAAKIAVLAGTALSATAAAVLLRRDARRARARDENADGVVDAVQPAVGGGTTGPGVRPAESHGGPGAPRPPHG